ncbi:MAG: TetR/AcrR family transcriptional regulator [Pseudomonadota bacterium]
MTDTRTQLLDAAEHSMRKRGYHAVSFRDLADELGIKSASVHYHFRQKEDLGVALVQRYASHVLAALELKASGADSPAARFSAFKEVYRDALVTSDEICLCGMLGAEALGLPDVVAAEVRRFFEANVTWLMEAQSDTTPEDERRQRALHIVAALQGAMMLASTLGDFGVFDEIADRI